MLSTALGMMYPKFSHSEDSSMPTKVRMLWRSFNSPHQSKITVLFVGVSEGQRGTQKVFAFGRETCTMYMLGRH